MGIGDTIQVHNKDIKKKSNKDNKYQETLTNRVSSTFNNTPTEVEDYTIVNENSPNQINPHLDLVEKPVYATAEDALSGTNPLESNLEEGFLAGMYNPETKELADVIGADLTVEKMEELYKDGYTVAVVANSEDDINNTIDALKESGDILGYMPLDYAKYDTYSNTNQTTYSNVYINQVSSNITNEAKNRLTEEDYKIYTKYLEGQTIKDIVGKNGQFSKINSEAELERLKKVFEDNEMHLSDEEVKVIADRINKALDDPELQFTGIISDIGMDENLLNTKFVEIVSDPSGYDAIVLENDEDIWVINSCTNSESTEDLAAIAFTILRQLAGNDELYNYFSGLVDGSDISPDIKDIADFKNYYNSQIGACRKLIEKYSDSDKQLRLGGYSLGGGIMLDSYAHELVKDPEKHKNTTVTVYNPFIAYCEEDILNLKNTLTQAIKLAGDNVVIYAAEGDVVSQFNCSTATLANNIVYIPGNEDNPVELKSIEELMSLITDPKSRHNFSAMDPDAFGATGILKDRGDQITTNEIAGGDVKTNNYSAIVGTLLDEHVHIDDYLEGLKGTENEFMIDSIKVIYNDLKDYAITHAGHYGSTYDEFIDALAPGLYKLAQTSSTNQYGIFGDAYNSTTSPEAFKIKLHEYFESPEGQEQLSNLLSHTLSNSARPEVNMDNATNDLTAIITDIYKSSSWLPF